MWMKAAHDDDMQNDLIRILRQTLMDWERVIRPTLRVFIGALTVVVAGMPGSCGAQPDALAWPRLTAEARPWTWWWWHGSVVDETNIALQLRQFRDAGLGGVQITTIYGVNGAEAQEIPYLTPRWLAMMGYTVDEAGKLGMGADMSLGSGWCFGGPTVSASEANASVVVETYTLGPGQKLKEKFNRKTIQALIAMGPEGKSTDLTDRITPEGELLFSPEGIPNSGPQKSWTVYALSQKPSGQKVKRAAPGGEGWMLNPLYPRAMQDWLKWFDAALDGYAGAKPQAVFQDSYEYRTDWSPDFLAQFERLRGYPLQDELPSFFGDRRDDRAARVKYDYRSTVSEILAEQSEPAWIQWAHQNGFATIYQAHGTPANWLDLYGDADMPETEMFHNDRNILISKFASSAAHTQGRPLTGAETGTWLKEHFTETLADVKYLADDMFLSGVNRIFYHGACYSPADAPWPGWLFYAATEMNPRNSIWHDVSALNQYISRCQSILQAGQSDNDLLLYWPVADFWSNPSGRLQAMTVSSTDWFAKQPFGKTAHELWNRGYTFDYVSDAQLNGARVAGGKIQMPGGQYQALVVPACHYLPLATFRQIVALANGGATVIFENQLPADVPGWADLDGQRKAFHEIAATISQAKVTPDDGGNSYSMGLGRILAGNPEIQLPLLGCPAETMARQGLSFVRRACAGGWNYFIANRGITNFDGWVTLAQPVQSAALLDPITGITGFAKVRTSSAGAMGVRLQLPPGGSVILRAFAGKTGEGPVWSYWQDYGRPVEITGTWKVHFITGGPSLPADAEITNLISWTTFGGGAGEAFGGTARYEILFDAPAVAGSHYCLELGDVRQSARVQLNGKDYGTLIVPPFRVEVDNLKPAGNRLEVEVTSVDANRIRDMDRRGVQWKIFKDINIVNASYQPFDASHWPLTECGLLGPVTLTSSSAP